MTIPSLWRANKFRESRDPSDNLTFLRGQHRLEAIKDMQVVDIEKGILIQLRELPRR